MSVWCCNEGGRGGARVRGGGKIALCKNFCRIQWKRKKKKVIRKFFGKLENFSGNSWPGAHDKFLPPGARTPSYATAHPPLPLKFPYPFYGPPPPPLCALYIYVQPPLLPPTPPSPLSLFSLPLFS